MFTKVDDADSDELSKFKWQARQKGGMWYAARSENIGANKYRSLSMHRAITNAPQGFDVDHINGDPLDNQRANLRICTHAENQRNMRGHRDRKLSRFKGVSLHPDPRRKKRWEARICVSGKVTNKYFETETEAAHFYNELSARFHGVFGKKNEVAA